MFLFCDQISGRHFCMTCVKAFNMSDIKCISSVLTIMAVWYGTQCAIINVYQFLFFVVVSSSRGLDKPRQNGESRYQWVRTFSHKDLQKLNQTSDTVLSYPAVRVLLRLKCQTPQL